MNKKLHIFLFLLLLFLVIFCLSKIIEPFGNQVLLQPGLSFDSRDTTIISLQGDPEIDNSDEISIQNVDTITSDRRIPSAVEERGLPDYAVFKDTAGNQDSSTDTLTTDFNSPEEIQLLNKRLEDLQSKLDDVGEILITNQGNEDISPESGSGDNCITPDPAVTTGYDLSNVQETDLSMGDSFNVSSVGCAVGYTGEAIATACTVAGQAYTLSGCTPEVASRQRTCADINGEGNGNLFTCESGYTLKNDPETIECTDGNCSRDLCCTNTGSSSPEVVSRPVASRPRTCADINGEGSEIPFPCVGDNPYLTSYPENYRCSGSTCSVEECCNPQESTDGIDYHEVVINSDPRISIKIKKTPRVIDNDILKEKLEAIIIVMSSNLPLAVKNMMARANSLDTYILIFHCNSSRITENEYINNRSSAYDYITDLTPYTYLRGGGHAYTGRQWEGIRYGFGGMLLNPVTSVCDQDILCDTPNRVYKDSNIFVHEFSHHIMEIGLRGAWPDKHDEIRDIFINDYRPLLPPRDCDRIYACSSAGEFFAMASMVWFNVGGAGYWSRINTIDEINQNVPRLYALLEEIYGEPVDMCDTILDHCIPLCS